MAERRREHIYRGEGGEEVKKEFEERYGKRKGDYVYGAKTGEQYRERHGGRNWNEGKHHRRRRHRK